MNLVHEHSRVKVSAMVQRIEIEHANGDILVVHAWENCLEVGAESLTPTNTSTLFYSKKGKKRYISSMKTRNKKVKMST